MDSATESVLDSDTSQVVSVAKKSVAKKSVAEESVPRNRWLERQPLNYIDSTLVRLASSNLRSTLFDQLALEQILHAAYDAEAITLEGPYTAVFDSMFIGVSIPRRSLIEGMWGPTATAERNEARFYIHGIGAASVHVDALWRGAIVARAATSRAVIESVTSAWASTDDIDAEIASDLGTLPSDPAILETERRTRLLGRLHAVVGQPDALSETWLDGWLGQLGVHSVSDLLARLAGQTATGAFQIGLSAPISEASTPRALPLEAALLIRDQPLSVSRLVADSKLVHDQLEELGAGRAQESDAGARTPLVVAWVVPDATFDDPDWPGGEAPELGSDEQRQLRRIAAGEWLAREGIGLVVTPAH